MIAPIGLEPPGQPLNINADTVAGEIARAAEASSLVFLTDVAGVLDGAGALIEELDAAGAAALREAGVLDGGMIPKIDAALRAAERGVVAHVANGRLPHTTGTDRLREVPGHASEELNWLLRIPEDRDDLVTAKPFRLGGSGFRYAPSLVAVAARLGAFVVASWASRSTSTSSGSSPSSTRATSGAS